MLVTCEVVLRFCKTLKRHTETQELMRRITVPWNSVSSVLSSVLAHPSSLSSCFGLGMYCFLHTRQEIRWHHIPEHFPTYFPVLACSFNFAVFPLYTKTYEVRSPCLCFRQLLFAASLLSWDEDRTSHWHPWAGRQESDTEMNCFNMFQPFSTCYNLLAVLGNTGSFYPKSSQEDPGPKSEVIIALSALFYSTAIGNVFLHLYSSFIYIYIFKTSSKLYKDQLLNMFFVSVGTCRFPETRHRPGHHPQVPAWGLWVVSCATHPNSTATIATQSYSCN